ncbi:hypothetical protein [Clostridium ihumii]|uniref:hypothetical protein n=1 Tax=Clostridium ihumii TaxID=1470356 RepID=UPI000556B622|nr:hypothetical protein [Clostridium ihumii]
MHIVDISKMGITELKKYLKENDISADVIRIQLVGKMCKDSSFILTFDGKDENDNLEEVEDIIFLVNKHISEKYGKLKILAPSENGLDGFSVVAEKKPKSCCSTGKCKSCSNCSSCCKKN